MSLHGNIIRSHIISQKLKLMNIIQVTLASVEYKAIILDCLVVTEEPRYRRMVNLGLY